MRDLSPAQRKEIADIHYGMVDVVVNEFLSRPYNRQFRPYRDEFYSVAVLSLVKASHKFDPHRGVLFRSYASDYIRAMMVSLLRKIRRRIQKEQSLDAMVGTSFEPYTVDKSFSEWEDQDTLNKVREGYKPRDTFEELVLEEVFFNGKSPKQFCEEQNVGYWKAWHKIVRIRKLLKEQYKDINKEFLYTFKGRAS